MKNTPWLAIVSFTLFLCSCSRDDAPILTEQDDFFINFSLNDSTFTITGKNYQLQNQGNTLSCGVNFVDGQLGTDQFIRGMRSTVLEDNTGAKPIKSVRFAVGKKIFRDELNTKDELGYLDEVVNDDNFGFPISELLTLCKDE